MLIVGLTGGIAAGKSTVSNKLKNDYHLTIVDADVIAKQVQEPGNSAYKKVVEYFGPKVETLLLPDGKIDGPTLGKYVFANKDELKVLNGIVHPAVRYEIFKQILWAYVTLNRLVILDVPLLFEAGLDKICGSTIAVVCKEDVQIERLLARNSHLTLDDAHKRINSQMSNHLRIRKADYVIDNSSSLSDLNSQVEGTVQRVKPSLIVYLLELIPPFAILSAFGNFVIRRYYDYTKHSKEE
ncbi:hypothetical protein BN7_1159 [Wickerhamomyces ciferrii]|uniref:Dephospho-CoA kinase n=1 Tax=Wickerhamomyces ciferrii (strain ATCC 14091 / BCRC 22168 / CBS 111 / JCM 3599 / NBRC 0793 / NRRL Y-1031 F-60-10) TaxID=1206466 RepID=K0KKH0_WICCF|nr:uncharacterized protein BN7_1159 [Wickerhamomyces ciferrii]CCH41618.1 hypothetical protein BN7_1159 [Wickerhamomyces ciferrii]